jgi:hypothetical protein
MKSTFTRFAMPHAGNNPLLVGRSSQRVAKALTVLALCLCVSYAQADSAHVRVAKTPNDGIQPQAVVDDAGQMHLIYFKGEPGGGDLFYVRGDANTEKYSEPVRVNSQPGSAIATGTIRGGQIALGKGGRVHVAWNGSNKALPKNPSGGQPMLYARLNDAGTAFEPQRNVMLASDVLDGGGTVAADRAGHVYVAWHAVKANGERGEDKRQIWVALSSDDGKSFLPDAPANDKPTGACGCCGMRATVDSQGNAYFLYRAATNRSERGMILLSSNDAGKTFTSAVVDKWKLNACPMSSESFAEGPNGVLGAWETQGKVYFAPTEQLKTGDAIPVAALGRGTDCKHPALAVNRTGGVLLAWTEGTGWQRGGDLAWQVYSKNGQPTNEHGRIAKAVPVWGMISVVAAKDGSFTIIH